MKVELDQCDIGDLILAIEEHLERESKRRFDFDQNVSPYMQTTESTERKYKRFESLKKYLSCKAEDNTENEYLERMKKIADMFSEEEIAHKEADKLLIEIIKRHGYNEIADMFNKMDKWYS